MIIKDYLEEEFQKLRKINNFLSQEIDQNGGYIPGIRPGNDTKKYFSYVWDS